MVRPLHRSERMRRERGGKLKVRHGRAIGLALVLAVAIVVAGSSRLHGVVEAAVELVGAVIQQHPGWGLFAFVTLAALSAMLAFFSSMVVVPVAAHHWGEVTTVALLWVGWLAGGAAAYALGRLLGSRVARHVVSDGRVKYYADRLTARAPFWMILLLQVALPSEIPGYVLGSLKYRFPAYFLALALAELPFAIGAVFLGSGFLNRQYWMMVVVGLAGIGFLAWAVRRLHLELEEKPRRPAGGKTSPAAAISNP